MRIVVIRFSSLGDCILLCPLLEHLKQNGAAEVGIITKRRYVELFAAARGVDRIIALDEAAGLKGLLQIIRTHRGDDCVVIDAHNNTRSRLVTAGLGGAEARITKHYFARLGLIMLKRPAEIPSVSERYSALAEALGYPPLERTTGGIDVPARARGAVEDAFAGIERDIIAIAPGSRWAMKRWGIEKYTELARRLVVEHDRHVLLLGDEDDAVETKKMAAALGRHATDLAGKTSVMEAAAALERCVGFVGNDSGLMHLAEAVDVPVVALFGPTVRQWGYYPSHVDSVVIERDIECRPCSRNGSRTCPKGTQECLTEIPVETVERATGNLLDRRSSRIPAAG